MAPGSVDGPDELGLVILPWVQHHGYTIPEAAHALGFARGYTLRRVLIPRCRNAQGLKANLLWRLANVMGEEHFQGRNAEEWYALLAPLWPARAPTLPVSASPSPVTQAILSSVFSRGLSGPQAGRIARVNATTMYGWLDGRCPQLRHFPGAARVTCRKTSIDALHVETARLIALSGLPGPSEAGILILDRLWQLGRSPAWLARQCHLDKKTVMRRLLYEAEADPEHLAAVIDALTLDGMAKAELAGCVHIVTRADRQSEAQKRSWRAAPAQRHKRASRVARRRWTKWLQTQPLNDHAQAERDEAWGKLERANAEFVKEHGSAPSDTRLHKMTGVRKPSISEWKVRRPK
jgi:hypothetical protein